MKTDFKSFVQLHSDKLYDFKFNSKDKSDPNKSTARVMESRIKQLKLRYDAIQCLDDQKEDSMALIYLMAAKHSVKNQEHALAKRRLVKAEKIAIQENDYFLLTQIYNLKVEHSELFLTTDFDGFYHDIIKNQEKLNQSQTRQALFAEVKRSFIAYLHQDESDQLEDLLNSVLSKYTENLEDVLSIYAIFQMLTILDTIGSVHHKFGEFDLFFENRLLQFAEEKSSSNLLEESLYLMANIAFRSGDFTKAKQYLMLFKQKADIQMKPDAQAKYHFLKSLISCFEGNLEEAIRISDVVLSESLKSKRIELNVHLAKVMFLLLSNRYKEALSLLNQLYLSDLQYIRIMGREWLIYQQMMNIILLFERDNFDIAEIKIQQLLRKHKNFLMQKSSVGVFAYIKLVKRLVEGHHISEQQLDDYFKLHFETVSLNNTDVFLKSFYAWVKAKVYKVDIYPTLLELVKD